MASTHSQVAHWQYDLLPHIVDRVARDAPDTPYGLWLISSMSYEEGYQTITYSQLANAVNGLAWWFAEHLGPGQGDVVVYIGPNDLRLTALLLATIKTNYVIFFSSPRNSPAAHKALLETLKCKTLVTISPAPPPALAILEVVQPQKLTIPEVDELVGKVYEHYKCDRTYEKNGRDPIWAIHTSGSTGFPKPIIGTSEAIARHHNGTDTAPPEGVRSLDHFERGRRMLTTLPPFHGAGLGQYIFWGIPFGSTPIAPLSATIPTAVGLVEALKKAPADIALVVPSVVAELAEDLVSLEYVAASIKLLVYLGGDLPQSVGDRVATKVPLRCQYGCSEIGFAHQLWPTELGPLDWKYIRFHPCTGAVFEETVDGTYELVFKRHQQDSSLLKTQSIWSILNQERLAEFRTRDLWEPHPAVPDAWRWVARTDDIIVFLNGEKTNPVTMEQSVVASNPGLLVGAIVVGAQRFQAALLVEPPPTLKIENTADEAALIERIWPSIEEANSIAPAHAYIEKSKVLIGDPKRPLIRAAKGTIQRAVSLAQYSAEIDKLYAAADAAEGDNDIMADEMHIPLDRGLIMRRIREAVLFPTGWQHIEDSTGFFDSGMDLLQALRIIHTLRGALGASHLALSTLYQNPSIARLAEAILSQKSSDGNPGLMQSLLGTYSGLIQQIKPTNNGITAAANTDVILTGSTGTLGTQILRALLDRPGVGHIYCLNRGADGGYAVQHKRFGAAGISGGRLDNRVTFLQVDLAQPFLNLEKDKYETLRSRVGVVIHNAWPVNFNLDLLAFRRQLAGLVNLFALSNAAAASEEKKNVKFLFVSSVGVVVDGTSGNAPEALVELPRKQDGSSSSNGYSKSKLLAEHLCDVAARHLNTSAPVARVGQVAGAINHKGVWNPAEWLPSLVMSSRHLGCLPDNLGPRFSTIDWVPVDALADVVVDLMTHHPRNSNDGGDVAKEPAEGAWVRNIRNPAVVNWEDVLPAIKEGIEGRGTIDVVPASAWLHRLEMSVEATTADDADAIAANPAVKLIEFYNNSVWNVSVGPASSETAPMAIEKTLDASPTLRDLPPVSRAWMRKWVDEWLATVAVREV
ncbi:acetyl-CoA synthetase-like protein [Xylaria bambusicola]|uniref:acetyl-CoA synthetase-like protein n=1 Tax=Xylaria bambusicola TaxID=326684 RepID=UPI002008B64D|nr:acetyl-CoA synthetase-like protein [Xylaria bambusicola]KAI0518045.1 acetyl-CoA synthetase-like protein [Xylaria bambusicola]